MNYENLNKEELIKIIHELENKLSCRGRKKKLNSNEEYAIQNKYKGILKREGITKPYTVRELAEEYKVNVSTIHKIIKQGEK